MIGHLAWQEQLYWLKRAQSRTVAPEVDRFGYGKPLTVPPLDDAWQWWRTVTAAADEYLDALRGADLDHLQSALEIAGASPAAVDDAEMRQLRLTLAGLHFLVGAR